MDSNPSDAAPPARWKRVGIAALLALISGGFLGVLYVGRGRLALSYFFGAFLFVCGCIALYMAVPLTIPAINSYEEFHTYYQAVLFVILGGVGAALAIHALRSTPEAPRPWFSRWYGLLGAYVLSMTILLGLSGLLRAFVIEPFSIPGGAMQPTINPGDDFFAVLIAYRTRAPQRGDIIVYTRPENGLKYVHRLVGIPGDTVEISDGVLSINSEVVPCAPVGSGTTPCVETLGAHRYMTFPGFTGRYSSVPATVLPADAYYVMGDNRDFSFDSRAAGPILRDSIKGKVIGLYWQQARHRTGFQTID